MHTSVVVRLGALVGLVVALGGAACNRNAECTINSDCSEGRYCASGTCQEGCTTARDCPPNHACNANRCELDIEIPDAGSTGSSSSSSSGGSSSAMTSSSSVVSSSSSMGGTPEDGACSPLLGGCAAGLECVQTGGPVNGTCLRPCTVTDGGASQCAPEKSCVSLSGGAEGACLRMVGRDESCLDFFDPMATIYCEPGLSRLVDNVDSPTNCGCKLLCNFADCPGASCPCPASETCVAGVLNSPTQGACGTTVPVGQTCADPFSYPFGSSEYCAPASLPPGVPQPIPYCYFDSFETFTSSCQLLCGYPGFNSTCPAPLLCQDADPEIWGPDTRTCQPLRIPDAGVVLPDAAMPADAGRADAHLPDAAVRDAATPDAAGADAGRLDAGVTDAAVIDAALDAGASDGAGG